MQPTPLAAQLPDKIVDLERIVTKALTLNDRVDLEASKLYDKDKDFRKLLEAPKDVHAQNGKVIFDEYEAAKMLQAQADDPAIKAASAWDVVKALRVWQRRFENFSRPQRLKLLANGNGRAE